MDTVLQLEEVLDLLATAVKLPFPEPPHQPLHYGTYPSASPLALLGLLILLQEAQQSMSFDAFDPKVDCLPVLSQPVGNACLGNPLFVQLPAESDQSGVLHVHDSTWTVGFLRKHCGNRHIYLFPKGIHGVD